MNSNNGDDLLQEVLTASRKVILGDEDDSQGLTNQDKWELIRSNLPEVREQGFLADVNYAEIYANEVGTRLLAYMFLAGLQADAFELVMIDHADKGRTKDEPAKAIDILYHVALLHKKKLLDKYNALRNRQKTWKHTWIH